MKVRQKLKCVWLASSTHLVHACIPMMEEWSAISSFRYVHRGRGLFVYLSVNLLVCFFLCFFYRLFFVLEVDLIGVIVCIYIVCTVCDIPMRYDYIPINMYNCVYLRTKCKSHIVQKNTRWQILCTCDNEFKPKLTLITGFTRQRYHHLRHWQTDSVIPIRG